MAVNCVVYTDEHDGTSVPCDFRAPSLVTVRPRLLAFELNYWKMTDNSQCYVNSNEQLLIFFSTKSNVLFKKMD